MSGNRGEAFKKVKIGEPTVWQWPNGWNEGNKGSRVGMLGAWEDNDGGFSRPHFYHFGRRFSVTVNGIGILYK